MKKGKAFSPPICFQIKTGSCNERRRVYMKRYLWVVPCVLGLVVLSVVGHRDTGHIGHDSFGRGRYDHSSAVCPQYQVPQLESRAFFGEFLNSVRLVGYGAYVGAKKGADCERLLQVCLLLIRKKTTLTCISTQFGLGLAWERTVCDRHLEQISPTGSPVFRRIRTGKDEG